MGTVLQHVLQGFKRSFPPFFAVPCNAAQPWLRSDIFFVKYKHILNEWLTSFYRFLLHWHNESIHLHIQGPKHFWSLSWEFPLTFNMVVSVTWFIDGWYSIRFSFHERRFPIILHSLWKEPQNNRQWQKESRRAKNAADCICISRHYSLQTELTTLCCLLNHLFMSLS